LAAVLLRCVRCPLGPLLLDRRVPVPFDSDMRIADHNLDGAEFVAFDLELCACQMPKQPCGIRFESLSRSSMLNRTTYF
jgi:hypothetical protein